MLFLMGKYLWNLYCAESPPILHTTWLLISPFYSEKNCTCRNRWKKGSWVVWFLSFKRRFYMYVPLHWCWELLKHRASRVIITNRMSNNHASVFTPQQPWMVRQNVHGVKTPWIWIWVDLHNNIQCAGHCIYVCCTFPWNVNMTHWLQRCSVDLKTCLILYFVKCNIHFSYLF